MDWVRIGIVGAILVAAIATNVIVNLKFHNLAGNFPAIGVAVWVVILACAPLRKPEWKLVPEAFKGSLFLLSLVMCASMMPVEKLPAASWQSSFALGFISSVFDNIPLTALALMARAGTDGLGAARAAQAQRRARCRHRSWTVNTYLPDE